ncbi:MAG: cytochrome P450 [Thermoleophilia bacterium]|nr:cytochrome P450 [Thermoleophilia bacterium]
MHRVAPHPPPGPGARDIPWLVRARARDPLVLIRAVRDRYGDVAHLSVAGRHVVLVSDPALAVRLLAGHAADLVKWRLDGDRRVLFGDGLLTSDGDLWRRQRRIIQPAFERDRMGAYAEVIVRHAAARVAGWPDGAVVDAGAEMTAITTTVVGEVMFGMDLGPETARIRDAVGAVMAFFQLLQPPLGGLRSRLPGRVRRRFLRARAELDALVARAVAARRAADVTGDDMLGMLLAARDEYGRPLPAGLVRDEMLTMLGAGLETTASALAFAWWEVARHPDAAARLEEEARAWEGTADPAALPFARAVFEETLRLHPPAWIVSRVAAAPVPVRDWTAPAGTILIISPYLMHRDARWFPDPERFDPDRPLPADGASGFLPFGAGPRKCVGTHLARAEGPLVLATVAREVRLRPAGPAPRERPMVTLRPDRGPMMRVERRSSPARDAAPH